MRISRRFAIPLLVPCAASPAEVGDHFGQIYEKTGRRDDAVRLYAEALNASRPQDLVREHFAPAIGARPRVDAVVTRLRETPHRAGTIQSDARGPAGKRLHRAYN